MRWVLAIGLLACRAAALAASEAHGGHAHGIPWATLVFSTINLLIFVYLIARFAWPAIRDWVADRRRQIVEALEAAARAKAEAEQLKHEWEQRLARLERELDEMRARARADAERERDRILADARTAAAAILRDAHRSAEQDVRTASAQLRAEVAERAYTLACQTARTRLTASDQDRFIGDFLQQVKP